MKVVDTNYNGIYQLIKGQRLPMNYMKNMYSEQIMK